MDLHHIRAEYSQQELNRKHCLENPIEQFQIWLQDAVAAQVNEPTAMNIATVNTDGLPDSRMVLLKEVNSQGFVFFTNYNSQKGQALTQTPFAALTFFWAELERQVRIRGEVSRLPETQSDDYFASRPYTSRIGAWASEQSQVIESKSTLLKRAAYFTAQHPLNVPRPPHWGGYLLTPNRIEFWQGRPSRLHDRIVYRLNHNHVWQTERLAP